MCIGGCRGAMEVYWCRNEEMQRCSGTEEVQGAEMQKFIDAVVQWCTGAVMKRCRNEEVQWFS